MAHVLNRITKQYLDSVNTPDYPITDWIINPVLPDCDKKYWIIEGDNIREMNTLEKKHLEYITHSTIYLIAEKQLLTDQNGTDYEKNINAIINPVIPDCELKYTKVENNTVVVMTETEKKAIDMPIKIAMWEQNVTDEIRKSYTVFEELDIIRNILFKYRKDDPAVVELNKAVSEAKAKFPKLN